LLYTNLNLTLKKFFSLFILFIKNLKKKSFFSLKKKKKTIIS